MMHWNGGAGLGGGLGIDWAEGIGQLGLLDWPQGTGLGLAITPCCLDAMVTMNNF